MWTQIILFGILSCAACEETSDWNNWINARRSLNAGKNTYSTANCNCKSGICHDSPPMCCSGLSLCQSITLSWCSDHKNDAANCGQCGNKCASGRCSSGTCIADKGSGNGNSNDKGPGDGKGPGNDKGNGNDKGPGNDKGNGSGKGPGNGKNGRER